MNLLKIFFINKYENAITNNNLKYCSEMVWNAMNALHRESSQSCGLNKVKFCHVLGLSKNVL